MDQGVAANKNSQNSQFFRFRRAPWRLEELSLRWTGSQQDVSSWKPKDLFENQQLCQLCEQTKQNQSFQQSLKQTRTLFSSADYATSSPDQTGLKEHNQLHLQYSPFLSFACTKHGVRSLASAGACQKLASHSLPHKRPRRQTMDVRGFTKLSCTQTTPCNTKFWWPRAKVSWVCFARPNASVSSVGRLRFYT